MNGTHSILICDDDDNGDGDYCDFRIICQQQGWEDSPIGIGINGALYRWEKCTSGKI